MGAFGRLLIQSLGGNLQAYDTCDNINIPDTIMSDEEIIKNRQEWWETCRHRDIYYIRDKITYGRLKIEDVTQQHFINLPKGCYEYFLIWKSRILKH